MRVPRHVAGALLLLLLAACGPPPLGEIPAGTVTDWPAYGAAPGGTHFSRADQITPENVAHLEVAWEHRSGDIRQAQMGEQRYLPQSSLQVTPIVVDDRLYYCSPFNKVFALNAETGEALWSHDPEVDREDPFMANCRGVSSWQSGDEGFCEHRILVGTLDARLIALDAETGELCTDFGDGGEVDISHGLSAHNPVEYAITSPPAILGDRVISGAQVLDNVRVDVPSGVVRAYDIRSGELLWVWNPVPPGSAERNPDGTFLSGTTNVWSMIAADPERDMVYVPTGNTSPDYYGGHRGDLDYYSSSVVALHGETGEVAWHYQMVHHDVWDYDIPAQPTLVDMKVNGKTVPAVVQVTKMGMTFALHRDTGEPLWPVEERPVSQQGAVPEETLSPTQPFPTHIPHLIQPPLTPEDAWGMILWDKWQCADKIAGWNNGGFYTPPSLQGSINFPSNGGGNNWGSPAIHPDSRVMVVYTNHVPGQTRLIPREQCEGIAQQQRGTPYCVETGWLMSPLGVPCSEPPWGTLDAIDLEAGKLLWRVPLGTTRNMAPFPFWWIKGLPGFGAPMITTTGLVFSGISNEHVFRAFALENGEELWRAELPTAANALPLTYQTRAAGRQFVVVAAGGHWGGGSPAGDHLIAFALPERSD
ncbi:MAG: pyrroloquinoline quinone-dependent dehydrogenase [Gammaproteobacteria bacterium]|nr:pyrroloquinoline quinone-dependent dehydrogenase [Gammaproteobacteria bacterium]